MMTSSGAPALEARNLRKVYPGVVALSDVSLRLEPGELHALVGENGAGKSTLVKLIAGQLTPDGGDLWLNGARVEHFSPQAARALGVTMVPQHPALFHSLSALENLFVGAWPAGPLGTVSWKKMRSRAYSVLEEMQVEVDLDAPAGDLSVAQRQMLQIARSLLADARLFIFDEPTAPLGQEETRRLFELIRRLHQRGVTAIYISHRLAEVFELADRLTVLRDGQLVATRPTAEVTLDDLISMMVGGKRATALGRSLPAPGRMDAGGGPAAEADREEEDPGRCACLRVTGLWMHGSFADISLQVGRGEIVGLAGVAGSGRNELLRALAGVEPWDGGAVWIGAEPAPSGDPQRMRDLGVGFVPGDRHHEALILPMSVRENITLGCLREFAGPAGLVRRGAETETARRLATELDLRATGVEQPVATLSGGNQQKVALASRLATHPRVLLLEEPTQGVDVGARAEIHRLMRDLASRGVGIVLVSSDLPELLALSDRVLVMHRGRLVGELAGEAATQERVLELALGAGESGSRAPSETPAPRLLESAGAKGERGSGLRREVGLAILLVALVGAVSLRAPNFATVQNLMDVLVNCSYLLIAACGMTLVILTGGIDISAGSVLAVCATAAGASAAAGLPVWAVLGVALFAGLVLGAVNAGLVTGVRIPPIIATLATLTLFRHVLIHFSGGRWINLPPDFQAVVEATPLGVPVPLWVATTTALVVAALARHWPLGRAIYAVGSNPEAAAHLGVSVQRTHATVYLGMGLLMGLAAFVYAGRWSAIQTNAGQGMEMVIITAVVVGGTNIFGGSGTIGGTVLGVLLLGVITASLTPLRLNPAWEKTFQGGLILLAVMADSLRGWRRRGP